VRCFSALSSGLTPPTPPPSTIKPRRRRRRWKMRGAPPPTVIRPPNAAADRQFVGAQLYFTLEMPLLEAWSERPTQLTSRFGAFVAKLLRLINCSLLLFSSVYSSCSNCYSWSVWICVYVYVCIILVYYCLFLSFWWCYMSALSTV